jgi:hypothetical protein
VLFAGFAVHRCHSSGSSKLISWEDEPFAAAALLQPLTSF